MQLDKVTAEIRPRGRWESIDLGCALVRENYAKIMAAWFTTVVPFWLTIIALSQLWPFPEGRPWIAGLACLWVLPICGRVPLFVLSRRLFGEDSNWFDLIKAFPKMIFRRFFTTLVTGPFNPNRCLSQPVSELEGLKGKVYRERVLLLARNGGEGTAQAALISLVLVLATMFSILFVYFSVLGLFGDSVVLEKFWVEYVLESDATWIPVPYVWVVVGFTLLAVSLIEPFYVGAGFAMYVNSRTITEGWDIELAFKRMNARVSGVLNAAGKPLLLFAFSACFWGATPVQAAEGNPRLDQVMAHEDFEIKTEIEMVPVRESDDSDSWDFGGDGFSMLGVIVEIIFWLIVAAVIGGVVWLVYNNRHVFSRAGRASLPLPAPAVRSVMGMDVTPESLPENIVTAARKAWDNGNHQLALSLLYRGSISWMVHQRGVEICESDTEQDCVERAQRSTTEEHFCYFNKLTSHWIELAYGGKSPDDSELIWLCNAWPYRTKPVNNLAQREGHSRL